MISEEQRLVLELYIYCDIQELTLMDIFEAMKKGGGKINPQFKRKYEKALKDVRSVLKDVNVLSDEDKERYGETTDSIRSLLSLILSTTGGHPDKIENIKNLVYKYK